MCLATKISPFLGAGLERIKVDTLQHQRACAPRRLARTGRATGAGDVAPQQRNRAEIAATRSSVRRHVADGDGGVESEGRRP
jgi:hypothetical protein